MFELREWQKQALDKLLESKVMLAEVATGCGKTFFAIQFIRKLIDENPDMKFLVVVPKLVIMNGWLKELYVFFGVDKLSCFYGEVKEYSQIMITTTSSLSNVVTDVFDVLIIDEAHNFFSKRLMSIIKQEHWKYKLGLSATIYNKNYSHMELEKEFQFNKFTYDIAEGIKDGVLNKYEWCDIEITLDNISQSEYEEIAASLRQTLAMCGGFERYLKLPANDPRKAKINKLFDSRNKLIYNYKMKFEALRATVDANRHRKIIIFNQYNATADLIVQELNKIKIDSRVINSSLEEKEKTKRIDDFNNNKFNVLVTTKMFDEGYNLEALDLAIIFSGESNVKQSIQRVGRILRLKKYNSRVFQIYCVKTFEEKFAETRTNYFKEIAEKYNKLEW